MEREMATAIREKQQKQQTNNKIKNKNNSIKRFSEIIIKFHYFFFVAFRCVWKFECI